MARIVNKILPLQPVSMKGLDRFITKTKELLDAVILDDSMPLIELPACIATELYNDKSKELVNEWEECTELQLDLMLNNMEGVVGLPKREDILGATKSQPLVWDPLRVLKKSPKQSQLSYEEKQFALKLDWG